MDFNEEVERLLRNMDQRQEELGKETIAAFKEFTKELKKMSAEERTARVTQAKDTKTNRLRDEARANRAGNGSGNAKKSNEETRADIDRSKALKNLGESVRTAGRKMDGFSTNIITASDNLNDLNGMLKNLPLLGGLLGGAFAGLIVNGIQQTIESFRQLNKQGLYFGDSIFDINTAALQAGMGLKDFSDLVAKNAELVNRYGLDSIMDLNQQLNATGSELRKMGYTTQDITEHLFDYLEMQRLSGMKDLLNSQQDEIQANKMAKIVDDLAVATGSSIEDIRKQMMASMENSRFKSMAAGMADGGIQVAAFATAMKSAIPGIEDILADVSAGFYSKDFALLPEELKGIIQAVTDGRLSANDALQAGATWADNIPQDVRNQWSIAARTSSGEMFQTWINAWSSLSNIETIDGTLKAQRDATRDEMALMNEAMQNLRESAILPLIEAFKNLDVVKIEALSGAVNHTSTAFSALLSNSLTPENIERFNRFVDDVAAGDFTALSGGLAGVGSQIGNAILNAIVTTFSDPAFQQKIADGIKAGFDGIFGSGTFDNLSLAINNTTNAINSVADFWKTAVGDGGIISAGLTTAFGLLAASIVAGAGGRAGPTVAAATGGLGGTFGKVVGGQFMRSFNAAGIGMTLAGIVMDGIQGEIDKSTVGAGIGLVVGGAVGALFGGPAGAALGANIGGFIGDGIGALLETMNFGDTEAAAQIRSQITAIDAQIATATSHDQIVGLSQQKDQINAQADSVNETERAEAARLDNLGLALDMMLGAGAMSSIYNGTNFTPEEMDAYNSRLDITEGGIHGAEVNQMLETLRILKGEGSELAGGIIDTLLAEKMIDGFATGGIATSPSIFGEAGAEAAIPLDNGMRIPIAEVDIKGMTEIQQTNRQTAQMNSNLIEVMTGVKTSLDKFLNHTLASTQSKEQLEVLLGIYTKLESIDGSNNGILRNSKPSF